jgi:hypothetical protein
MAQAINSALAYTTSHFFQFSSFAQPQSKWLLLFSFKSQKYHYNYNIDPFGVEIFGIFDGIYFTSIFT